MHEIVVLVLGYARGAWRYRWWMLVSAWLICTVGWVLIALMPDEYRATAKVHVDTNSILSPVLGRLALTSGSASRKLDLVTKTMLSRPNLEKVMRMTDLDLQAKSPKQKEMIIDMIQEKITFSKGKRDNIYFIRYEDPSPELAKLVVKSLLTIFMESNLGEGRKNQDTQQDFLKQQIQEYERRLEEAELSLENFKKANLGFLSSQNGGYYQRLSEVKGQLEAANLEMKIEHDRLASLKEQLEDDIPDFDMDPSLLSSDVAGGGVDTTEFDSRISNLQHKLDDLLIRYTEKHPEVSIARKTLSKLKQEKRQYIRDHKDDVASGVEVQQMGNPFVQQIKISISESEANLAAKKVIVEEYKSRVQKLESAVDRVLKVEQQEKQLNRDYNIVKSNHQDLLKQLESSRLAKSADATVNTTQFKVIEPPRVPLEPTGPARIIFASAVFAASLLFGFALAFLLSQIRPTYDDRNALQEGSGLPVLGSVDMVWTQLQISSRKKRNYSFFLGISSLTAFFGLVLVVFVLNIHIFDKLKSLIGMA